MFKKIRSSIERSLKAPLLSALTLGFVLVSGCSSIPRVETQAYANLSNRRTLEYSFPIVWKAINETLADYKVLKRDPESKDLTSLRKAKSGTLETDWIYGQSRDKSQQYSINGSPRKIELPIRFKYLVEAKSTLGGTTVIIQTSEEVEKVNSEGAPTGYSSEGKPDPSRASELLDKIQLNILTSGI